MYRAAPVFDRRGRAGVQETTQHRAPASNLTAIRDLERRRSGIEGSNGACSRRDRSARAPVGCSGRGRCEGDPRNIRAFASSVRSLQYPQITGLRTWPILTAERGPGLSHGHRSLSRDSRESFPGRGIKPPAENLLLRDLRALRRFREVHFARPQTVVPRKLQNHRRD